MATREERITELASRIAEEFNTIRGEIGTKYLFAKESVHSILATPSRVDNWQSETESDSYINFDPLLGILQLEGDGVYIVSYEVSVIGVSGSSRSEVDAVLMSEGAPIESTRREMYVRQANYGASSTGSAKITKTGPTIDVFIEIIQSQGTTVSQVNAAVLRAEYIGPVPE